MDGASIDTVKDAALVQSYKQLQEVSVIFDICMQDFVRSENFAPEPPGYAVGLQSQK